MKNLRADKELLISLRNVGVYYRRRHGFLPKPSNVFWALKDVSLDLYRGEALGVIGRNGAGKTTLLKLLAGMIRPDRGTMVNNGDRAALLSLQVGFLPYLTGRENAILSGLLLGLRRSEIVAMMDEIIAFAEMEDFIDQLINTYSTGMKARLGFSVALQMDPDILLIDETLGVGDAAFNQKSSAAMKDKIRSDKTVVLVTHSASTIQEFCDRAVWMEKGITRMQGEPEEIVAAYENFIESLKK